MRRTRFGAIAALSVLLVTAGGIEARASSVCEGATLIDGIWYGTSGVDLIDCRGSTEAVHVRGLAGDDLIYASPAGGVIFAGDGSDTIHGGAGTDRVFADEDGELGADTIFGGGGNDQELNGGAGDDTIHGGAGNDGLLGGAGNDTLYPGAGSDWVFADFGSTDGSIPDGFTRGTSDVLDVTAAPSGVRVDLAGHTSSGWGRDHIYDVDRVIGSAYGDTLSGDGGANQLDGGAGRDKLTGRDDDDILLGGVGLDTLSGGNGIDTCVDGERLSGCEVVR